ncbi:MAG: glycosyltransferase [Pseudomonadota bacterium]|nr:glycosyltransferase [Pseudomonadota bacterium]
MRIVIDMQGAQSSGSRNRGIGRYTQSLVQAIVKNRGPHEVIIALNGVFAESIAPIRALFDGLLPVENIQVWEAPSPVASVDDGNTWRRKTGELVREAFLESLRPDVVLVTSLFEGLSDDAVTSVGMLSLTVPTAVILYDLIPLIQRHHYLANPVLEKWYENKLDHLRRADLLLAISESSRQEGVRYLGFTAQNCVNISTAADAHFHPTPVDAARQTEVRARYGLLRPFVMYTGGIDHRKNIEGLIRAYALLPAAIRASHQLAIVCSIQLHSRHSLEKLAREQGLADDELVLTGFVSEEDLLALYTLCRMFVFPSWHEGFGLPALEAMACGRAVIGANTSSLPEVIGRADALFDPHSDAAIAEKILQVLTDDVFRSELEQHGLRQASLFSWDDCAQRAVDAMVAQHQATQNVPAPVVRPRARPRLAYVSPLPPERSGISDYSAELLPELSRHYEIDVITPQLEMSDPWIKSNCAMRSPAWLLAHADEYDRVLYHFGNSHFHQHMFEMLEEVPGLVVLHDFFLSGIASHMELSDSMRGFWVDNLYTSHGYHAVHDRFHTPDIAEVIWRYPTNLSVLRSALGVIVHAENSRRLASSWYPGDAPAEWTVIPHLRVPENGVSRAEARLALGLRDDDFVVCSFGLMGPTKLNHRLLDAWLASPLSQDENCILVFVGENQQGDYGRALSKKMQQSGTGERIRITRWTDTPVFRQYLAAANLGVQLRTLSRGETSGTVLDCMNYGLATIVNANGSMADLPDDGVVKLAEEFDDTDLSAALEQMWKNSSARTQLGARAREIIRTVHAPRSCADQYAITIEATYAAAIGQTAQLTRALARVTPRSRDDSDWVALAQSVAQSIAPRFLARQLLVDVSSLMGDSSSAGQLKLGSHGKLQDALASPAPGVRVEPVCQLANGQYSYARSFTLKMLDCPKAALPDGPVEFRAGDVLLIPGLAPQSSAASLAEVENLGVLVEYLG